MQIGAADPSLTATGGMVAVTELCGRLSLIAVLDEGIKPVKQGRGGSPAGRCRPGWPTSGSDGKRTGSRHALQNKTG